MTVAFHLPVGYLRKILRLSKRGDARFITGPRSIKDIERGGRLNDHRDSYHNWGVILAGGDGRRLLPLTRRIAGDNRPKQFCCVLGSETLLRQTRRRVAELLPPQRILIVLTKAHESFYGDQVDDVSPFSLLIQPDNRGTAPAILYSLMRIKHLDPNALVAFFPSDHYIGEDVVLRRHIDSAFRQASSHPNTVLLLGMSPDNPEVDYGWIQPGAPICGTIEEAIFHVDRFWEKPSQSLACHLMSAGCLWNSFIMVGWVQAFLNLIRDAVPVLFRSFYQTKANLGPSDQISLDDLYSRIPAVNFSKEVLSAKASALAVLRADDLEWSDLGEPGRVLSVIARKGIQKKWEYDPVVEKCSLTAVPV